VNILAIETSCDETAAAVVEHGQLVRSNVVSSQIALHKAYGGVVPELAARGHVKAIIPVVEIALAEAGVERSDLDALAVTQGPGLAGSLLVGVNFAKTMAYVLDRPLIPVNHLESHIYANWLTHDEDARGSPEFPILCLLVSGGHTELILMTGHGHYRHLGRTLDDAAGEAFDKGARLLGLGYPGGPAIQKAAERGTPGVFRLPRAWLGETYDFSFSGLKTALLREVEPFRLPNEPRETERNTATPFAEHRPPSYLPDLPVADFAAEFQEAIVDVLATKAGQAAKAHDAKTVVLAGGVAANVALRDRLLTEVEKAFAGNPPPVKFPAFEFCTDNAAMVGAAGYYALGRGVQSGWEVDVQPRFPLVSYEGGM
jgi:tRNA N6-adenosine threonylcarbamoyltransferase